MVEIAGGGGGGGRAVKRSLMDCLAQSILKTELDKFSRTGQD